MSIKSKQQLIEEVENLENYVELKSWCNENSPINSQAIENFVKGSIKDYSLSKNIEIITFDIVKGQILKGLRKYGVLIDDAINNLSFGELAIHKLEEMYDIEVYQISMEKVEE